MWVFIRPRGGQDCYLLTCEIRGRPEFCPIHRFDGMDQIPVSRSETIPAKSKSNPDKGKASQINLWRGLARIFPEGKSRRKNQGRCRCSVCVLLRCADLGLVGGKNGIFGYYFFHPFTDGGCGHHGYRLSQLLQLRAKIDPPVRRAPNLPNLGR